MTAAAVVKLPAPKRRAVTVPELLRPHDVVLVVGKRGTGKSTEAKALLSRLVEASCPVVVFDPHDEYSAAGRKSGQVRLGACRSRLSVEAFEAAELAGLSPLALADCSLSVVPDKGAGPRDMADDFAKVIEAVLSQGETAFFADEVGIYGQHASEEIDRLACQSRHASVPVVMVAQRMVQIPKTARTQATCVISFRQDNPDDLKALADLGGDDFAERVARLARGECEVWRDEIPDSPGKTKEEK